jgi:hypothetical protein
MHVHHYFHILNFMSGVIAYISLVYVFSTWKNVYVYSLVYLKCICMCLITTQTTFYMLQFCKRRPLPYRPTCDGASHTWWCLTGMQWDGEVIGCHRLHGKLNIEDGQLCTFHSHFRVGSVFVEFRNGCRILEYKFHCCFSRLMNWSSKRVHSRSLGPGTTNKRNPGLSYVLYIFCLSLI